MTDCTLSTRLSSKVKKRAIDINFSGGDVSGDGGVLLLKAVDDRLGLLDAVSRTLIDPRDPNRIKHTLSDLLKQRVFAIGAGYGDLNDHESLRLDAAIQSAVGTLEPLASASTLCRFESNASRESIFAMHEILLEQFIASYDKPPKSLILDFDGTDDRVHGEQQGRHFNTYYGGYCFFPLYVYCEEQLLVSYLRPSDRGDSRHSLAVLSLLVKGLRQHWPEVQIIFRGDCGFYSPLLLSWCERKDVKYIVGFGANAKLSRYYATEVAVLSTIWEKLEDNDSEHEGLKVFYEQAYQAGSWKTPRRVIAKLEHNGHGANQRFIVTNLSGDVEQLYTEVYCQRGSMENRHKELQMGLFADRTSCQFWWSNQLRVMFSSFAYTLLQSLRAQALKNTKLARAQVWTIREKLIKIGTVILRNTRRIEFRMSSACVYQEIFIRALDRLEAT